MSARAPRLAVLLAVTQRDVSVQARRAARSTRLRLVEDLERLRADAGISLTRLAAASSVDKGFLARIVAGQAHPTIETYARLATALGADLSARLYPNTGPAIRDRHQARIVEALLAMRDPRWQAHLEVAVRRPARGWIDVVLHDPRSRLVLAVEVESGIRRLEQLIRWSTEKADSLASWDRWAQLRAGGDAEPSVSRLLVVRRTRATDEVRRTFARELSAAFPAHPADAVASLTNLMPWPGPALVWVKVEATAVRFLTER